MEVVPIPDPQKITQMKEVMKRRERDALLFVLGINSALRISDLLSLSVGDVMDEAGNIADVIILKERKTGKSKRIAVNMSIKEALYDYLGGRPGANRDEPLFPSQKGGTLSRSQAWRIMSRAGELVGLKNIGTHSLRKTFGYHLYKKTRGDIGLVQKLMNHSTSEFTLSYIGIDQEKMDEAYLELNL
jgi:integrase